MEAHREFLTGGIAVTKILPFLESRSLTPL